ncbi:MAG: tRNA adenosine(34) deaminase TadA [Proteobacteria bacterium]|nr:tRNA adenosine(34) deaminase TadA [Pseudomonadota bacterium]MBU1738139.1 tRNA adenosine(34) deaminase TadA [Pseudomonadota bacterium]
MSPRWSVDHDFMRMALAEAEAAAGRGEVPIGAVVVSPTGKILARAGNSPIGRNDPVAHAEILALREAGRAAGNYRLTGCTVYVTLEPCVMCAGAMVHARIGHLVYGAPDPKGGGVRSCYKIGSDGLLNHELQITGGILAEESAGLLREFFKEKRRSAAGDAYPGRIGE